MATGPQPSAPRTISIVLPTILIIIGILLLLSNFGWLPWSFWGAVWRLWPIILILVGIEIIITRGAGWSIVATVAAVIGLVILLGFIGFMVGAWQEWGTRAMPHVFSSWATGVIPSGNVVSQEKQFSNFTRVDVGSAFEAQIAQPDSFSVTISADDNLIDRVVVTKEGQTLKIYLESFAFSFNPTLKANITMPKLQGLRLSGASRATVERFKSSDDLDVEISGASSLRGHVEAGNAKLNASGASRITLEGSANTAVIGVSGASRLDLYDFTVSTAKVEVSGASEANINVVERLESATVSGASRLTYKGSPTIGSTNISGGSSIKPD